MDRYPAYGYISDPNASRGATSDPEPDPSLAFASEQQPLPPFREILSGDPHPRSDQTQSQTWSGSAQPRSMITGPFHAPSAPTRPEQQSPAPSQTAHPLDGTDAMSGRGLDSTYTLPRHQRRNSSWASTSQYTDVASPYTTQQRITYPPPPTQPSYSSARASPSLPPIRDMTGYEPQYPPPTPYAQAYATPSASHGSPDNYAYGTEKTAFYDSTQRYAPSYSQSTRPPPSPMEYPRYGPYPYDYRPGGTYQSSYGALDYTPSPTGVHPSSPSVIGDTESRNRKRRGNLPRHITDVLRTWFHEHLDHPYPTEEDKQAFVAKTGLTIAQVSNWFINARRRQLPALRHARDRNAQMASAEYDSEYHRRQPQPESSLR